MLAIKYQQMILILVTSYLCSNSIHGNTRDIFLIPKNEPLNIKMKLSIDRLQPTYEKNIQLVKIGDILQFNYQVSKTGYASLWLIGSSGKANRLFPNQYETSMLIQANNKYHFPNSNSKYNLKEAGPSGMESIYLLWTETEKMQPKTINKEFLTFKKNNSWATIHVVYEVISSNNPNKNRGLKDKFLSYYSPIKMQTNIRGKVYVLAMGANSFGLTKTNQDAIKFTTIIKKLFDLPENRIRLYVDATHGKYVDGMKWVRKKANKNDVVIIYFSGHGTQVFDKNNDEKDGLDEALLMYLPNIKSKIDDRDIVIDDEYVKNIKQLKTKNIISIFDACFSGGLDRGNYNISYRSKFYKNNSLVRNNITQNNSNIDATVGVIIAASSEFEEATEGIKGGTFTYYLIKEMKSRANIGKSWRNIFEETKLKVFNSAGHIPVIIGNKSILDRFTLKGNSTTMH